MRQKIAVGAGLVAVVIVAAPVMAWLATPGVEVDPGTGLAVLELHQPYHPNIPFVCAQEAPGSVFNVLPA
jgi:hypothetical protein